MATDPASAPPVATVHPQSRVSTGPVMAQRKLLLAYQAKGANFAIIDKYMAAPISGVAGSSWFAKLDEVDQCH